jgi:hypothetical protein
MLLSTYQTIFSGTNRDKDAKYSTTAEIETSQARPSLTGISFSNLNRIWSYDLYKYSIPMCKCMKTFFGGIRSAILNDENRFNINLKNANFAS